LTGSIFNQYDKVNLIKILTQLKRKTKMELSKYLLLKGAERGVFGNSSFKINSVFSNGIAGTGRPDNFGSLLVFNDDIVSPEGFLGLHPHQNVEVIAVVLEGSEMQQDDKGNTFELFPDDFQLISSGSGIHHSAGNPSKIDFVRNLQIWIQPRELNTPPITQTKRHRNSESIINGSCNFLQMGLASLLSSFRIPGCPKGDLMLIGLMNMCYMRQITA
jgi:mannose-6-phosphate isomerase-like protein (cupin superfamily)